MSSAKKLETSKQAVKEFDDVQNWALYQERKLVHAVRVLEPFDAGEGVIDQGFLIVDQHGETEGVTIEEFERRFRVAEDVDVRALVGRPSEVPGALDTRASQEPKSKAEKR